MRSSLVDSLLRGVMLAAAVSVVGSATAAEPTVKKIAPQPANVVRSAPDVTWVGMGGKTSSIKTFRGQPVVILVAPNPENGAMRKEVGRIEDLYLQFAAKKTIFIAAFTGTAGRVASNIPFAIAANGADVAAAYGVPTSELSVIVLSPDGNVDMVSKKVEGAQRILDVINNSFQVQAASRTGIGS